MSTVKTCFNQQRNTANSFRKIKMRIHLNADALFARIRKDFAMVPDHRASNSKIPLADALMSGFAMFSLKDQSCSPLTIDGGTTRSVCIRCTEWSKFPATARCAKFWTRSRLTTSGVLS